MPARSTASAHVAQLVEHFLGKEEVTDSSSVMGSIFRLCELSFAKIRMTVRIAPMRTWLCQDSHDGQEVLHPGLLLCEVGNSQDSHDGPYCSYANLAMPSEIWSFCKLVLCSIDTHLVRCPSG